MTIGIRLKLSAMMFLEFFIWGAWFVTMSTYLVQTLKASDSQNASAYATQSWGAIIAPFIIGLIADRYFSAQKVLGVLHFVGGCLLLYITTLNNFEAFYPVMLAYMILYMPTLALVNSVAFKQMKDPTKEFPSVRWLGTIGWMVAGIIIGWLGWEKSGELDQGFSSVIGHTLSNYLKGGGLVLTFKMAGVASILLAVLTLFLPSTPPPKKNQKVSIGDILGLDSIGLLKKRSYLVFFLASIAICIPLAFYYNETNLFLNQIGVVEAAKKMSLGQFSELFFMIAMPFFFVRLGVKKMLAVGMFVWALRYVFFAYGDAGNNYWLLIVGILLHGACYDFFFVTGQIYTDRVAGERFKSAAQGFITLATYGVGMMMGYYISGPIADNWKTGPSSHDWKWIWLVPAAIAVVVLILFTIFFKDKDHTEMQPGLDIEEPSPQVEI